MLGMNEYSTDLQWCVHYMMRYWQHEVPIEGTQSIDEMSHILMREGYFLERKNWHQGEMQQEILPFFLKTKSGGYVVVLKQDNKRIWVEYPHLGKASYDLKQFKNYFETEMYLMMPMSSK